MEVNAYHNSIEIQKHTSEILVNVARSIMTARNRLVGVMSLGSIDITVDDLFERSRILEWLGMGPDSMHSGANAFMGAQHVDELTQPLVDAVPFIINHLKLKDERIKNLEDQIRSYKQQLTDSEKDMVRLHKDSMEHLAQEKLFHNEELRKAQNANFEETERLRAELSLAKEEIKGLQMARTAKNQKLKNELLKRGGYDEFGQRLPPCACVEVISETLEQLIVDRHISAAAVSAVVLGEGGVDVPVTEVAKEEGGAKKGVGQFMSRRSMGASTYNQSLRHAQTNSPSRHLISTRSAIQREDSPSKVSTVTTVKGGRSVVAQVACAECVRLRTEVEALGGELEVAKRERADLTKKIREQLEAAAAAEAAPAAPLPWMGKARGELSASQGSNVSSVSQLSSLKDTPAEAARLKGQVTMLEETLRQFANRMQLTRDVHKQDLKRLASEAEVQKFKLQKKMVQFFLSMTRDSSDCSACGADKACTCQLSRCTAARTFKEILQARPEGRNDKSVTKAKRKIRKPKKEREGEDSPETSSSSSSSESEDEAARLEEMLTSHPLVISNRLREMNMKVQLASTQLQEFQQFATMDAILAHGRPQSAPSGGGKDGSSGGIQAEKTEVSQALSALVAARREQDAGLIASSRDEALGSVLKLFDRARTDPKLALALKVLLKEVDDETLLQINSLSVRTLMGQVDEDEEKIFAQTVIDPHPLSPGHIPAPLSADALRSQLSMSQTAPSRRQLLPENRHNTLASTRLVMQHANVHDMSLSPSPSSRLLHAASPNLPYSTTMVTSPSRRFAPPLGPANASRSFSSPPAATGRTAHGSWANMFGPPKESASPSTLVAHKRVVVGSQGGLDPLVEKLRRIRDGTME